MVGSMPMLYEQPKHSLSPELFEDLVAAVLRIIGLILELLQML